MIHLNLIYPLFIVTMVTAIVGFPCLGSPPFLLKVGGLTKQVTSHSRLFLVEISTLLIFIASDCGLTIECGLTKEGPLKTGSAVLEVTINYLNHNQLFELEVWAQNMSGQYKQGELGAYIITL